MSVVGQTCFILCLLEKSPKKISEVKKGCKRPGALSKETILFPLVLGFKQMGIAIVKLDFIRILNFIIIVE